MNVLFFLPDKRRSSGRVLNREDFTTLKTNYQLITKCACVESPYYLARFDVCFPNVIKSLLHCHIEIYPYYQTFIVQNKRTFILAFGSLFFDL